MILDATDTADAPDVIAIPTLLPAPTTEGVTPAPATLNQTTTNFSVSVVSNEVTIPLAAVLTPTGP